MHRVIKNVRTKFILTILLVILSVIALSWGALQAYTSRELSAPAHISEVHRTAESNQAFAEYIEEQKDFEAHFITLASDIKQQESERVTRALALTSIGALLIGVVIALLATKRLMRPVIEAYTSQERFVQDAAHELRNPLAAMTAALQQAQKSQSKDTALLKTFKRQTNRLININEDLLFLERTTGKKLSRVNISELLEDVVEGMQPLAGSKKISIELESGNDIHKTITSEEYIRLTKNIIDNAIKYSPAGSRVSIRQARHKNTITISVRDQGIGIPQKELTSVGKRFFRASNTGSIEGTGLGLAIVQKILNIYGGSIHIESKPAKGSVFKITLPS